MRTFLIVAVLLGLSAQAAAAKVWTRSFDLAGRPAVQINAGDMEVRVHSRDSGPVEFRIEYERRAFGFSSPSSSEPRIEYQQNGDSITLRVREPKTFVTIGFSSIQQSIDVTVPVASDVSVHTTDGAVRCEPLQGHTVVETSDGTIRVMGLEGTTELRSSDGGIHGENLQGRLEARASDGTIDVEGRFERLALSTQDGRIHATARAGSRIAEPWELQTQDGSLRLEIPVDLAATLDARTRDGSLTVDLPIPQRGRVRGHDFTGELNGGGPLLRLRTGDGSLTLALAN